MNEGTIKDRLDELARQVAEQERAIAGMPLRLPEVEQVSTQEVTILRGVTVDVVLPTDDRFLMRDLAVMTGSYGIASDNTQIEVVNWLRYWATAPGIRCYALLAIDGYAYVLAMECS